MKRNTVNVLEVINGTLSQLIAYDDEGEGNRLAEIRFTRLARENGALGTEIEDYIIDGYFSAGLGYELYIIHSGD